MKLGRRIDENTFTVAYTSGVEKKRLRDLELVSVKDRDKEQEVIDSTRILLRYIEKEVLPTFDLFDDIDKRINGEGEDFRFDDNSVKHPYFFGNEFYIRRHIIARLCKTDEELERFIDRWITGFNEFFRINQNKPLLNRNETDHIQLKIINYIKDNVRPL